MMTACRGLLMVAAIWLTACQPVTMDQGDQGAQSAPECSDAHSLIGTIQGRDGASPMLGEQVTVRGVVTRQINAHQYFLQESAAAADADPLTSNAIMVSLSPGAQLTDVVAGSELMVAGTVMEQPLPGADSGSVTLLTQAQASVCAHGQPLPLQTLDQTVNATALEHMQVALQDWRVAAAMRRDTQDDHGKTAMSGTLMVASEHLYQPTQVVLPGTAAQRLAASNRAHSLLLQVEDFVAEQAWQMRAGDRLSVSGIVQPHTDGAQLVALADFRLGTAAVVEPPPARQDQTIRVLGLNLQNLFNGDGLGNGLGDGMAGGFPTARGAASPDEYVLQLARLLDAIKQMQPDVLALQELENDGFDPRSSIHQLKDAMTEQLQQPWALIAPPGAASIGSDAIMVGLLYRQDRLRPGGAAETLTIAPFDQLSRVPLAQRFRSIEGNLDFLINVNHFKSKGGCPDHDLNTVEDGNVNRGDGQACWNAARLQSAQSLQQWLAELQQQHDVNHVLIIGDLNAYRMEQPLQALTRNGWIDLVSRFQSMPLYSYRYRGQIGTLDYALASPALLPRVANAWYWNVNADASARRQQRGQPRSRFSDHDPVLVDLRLY